MPMSRSATESISSELQGASAKTVSLSQRSQEQAADPELRELLGDVLDDPILALDRDNFDTKDADEDADEDDDEHSI